MFELLHAKLTAIISVTEEEFNYCKTLFVPRKLRKKQFLMQEGDVCKYQAFVQTGMLRLYTVDEKGIEHIMQFSPEGWWVADLSSYITGHPSSFNIEALEDADLLLLSKPEWDKLMNTFPKFEHYFRIIIQNHLIATQNRLMQSITETAEEKYLRFVEMYPQCLQRIPQHMIASYLGITKETLSRLRKNMATRN